MKNEHKEQVLNIIKNFEEKYKFVPYLKDLEEHDVYGHLFKSLLDNEKKQIEELLNQYIIERINELKTKGGQLFRRFFENNKNKFWEFRSLNLNPDIDNNKFQELGKEIEQEMFKLEGILTQAMINQAQGLGKTVEAFYDIVYNFFPKYNEID